MKAYSGIERRASKIMSKHRASFKYEKMFCYHASKALLKFSITDK